MAKTTDNRKRIWKTGMDLRDKGRRREELQFKPSAVDELIDLLFSDEPIFAKYVLDRSEKLAEELSRQYRAEDREAIRRGLLDDKLTTPAGLISSMKPTIQVRRRLDEVFAQGPRVLTEPEARALMDDDPEALAFLRLKLQMNAAELSAPWVQEMALRLKRLDAARQSEGGSKLP